MGGRVRTIAIGLLAGTVAGAWWGPATALLTATAGGILGWAAAKGRLDAALVGAAKGWLFAVLVGPAADALWSGTPFTERLVEASAVGILLGATLGTRNARPASHASQSASTAETRLPVSDARRQH